MQNFHYHTTARDAAQICGLSFEAVQEYNDKISARTKNACFGVEIEKQSRTRRDAESAEELLLRAYKQTGEIWVRENDGSLNNFHGYELKSPPQILTENARDLLKFFAPVAYLINATDEAGEPTNCGGHIHISKPNTYPSALYQQSLGFLPLFYAIYAHRITRNSVSAIDLIKRGRAARLNYSFHVGYSNPKAIRRETRHDAPHLFAERNNLGQNADGDEESRYNAININTGGRTLEYRLFPHATSTAEQVWRVQLLAYLMRAELNKTEIQIAKAIIDPAHPINEYLREVYTPAGIVGIYRLFVQISKDLHNVPFRSIETNLHQTRTAEYLSQAEPSDRLTTASGRRWANPYAKIRAVYADILINEGDPIKAEAETALSKNADKWSEIDQATAEQMNLRTEARTRYNEARERYNRYINANTRGQWQENAAALQTPEVLAVMQTQATADAEIAHRTTILDLMNEARETLRTGEALNRFIAEGATTAADEPTTQPARTNPDTTQNEEGDAPCVGS